MSVAPVKKVTLAGRRTQKEETLAHLQALGCMHVVPLVDAPREPEKAVTRAAEDAYKALRFLTPLEGERRQVQRDEGFDVYAFIDEVLTLKQKTREVGDRRDFLADRIETLRPWGELVFPGHEATSGYLLWFYELPVKERAALQALDVPWEVVAADARTLYVVVIAPHEPDEDLLPVPRSHVGSEPISELEIRLIEAEIDLEALHADRLAQTRYLKLLRSHMSEAETKAELDFAFEQTRDDDDLFAVQGWVPDSALDAVSAYAHTHTLAMTVEQPAWHETPPTLLVQPENRTAGVDLAMFYQVPSYRDWDPTGFLMISFSVFFAMIVADAGYGLVILAGLLLGWGRLSATPKLQAWRRLGLMIAASTILYGVIVGSYFGAAPPDGSLLAALSVLSLDDFDTMMRLSILVGVVHLALAIGMSAWTHRRRRSARAKLGWIAVIVGGMLLWLSGQTGPLASLAVAFMAIGVLAIVAFTSERPITRPLDRAWLLFDGVRALGAAMGAFGDVLSYMRLFALGLASASLALTFNDLARQVMDAVPGLGLLLGLLILLVGHALNFGLAMMSGVVHGLRLNYIEFFKWGLPDEGIAFRPLARKEVQE